MVDPETKVGDILKRKLGRIKRATLEPGSPSWEEIAKLTWREIEEGVRQAKPGFSTIHKLLTDRRFDR